MEKDIRKQFTEKIYNELIAAFGIEPDKIKPLGGFESFIYQFEKNGREYVLRISHTGLRRSKGQILAEVDFINYLSDNGVPAARAVTSPRGRLMEVPQDENIMFAAVAFEKAPGGPPLKHNWTPEFIGSYGEIMGRMHRLTKDYKTAHLHVSRLQGMDDLTGFAEKFLPPADGEVIEKCNNMLDKLRTFPKGRDEYGLIHQDLHGGNFFVDENGRITIFDFDDSQYFWFAHDIAMTLFYVVPHNCVKKEDLESAQSFLKSFMNGYRRENSIDANWMTKIPTFISLREMVLYIAIHRSMDMEKLDSWCSSYMNGRREKILKNIQYVDIDFNI